MPPRKTATQRNATICCALVVAVGFAAPSRSQQSTHAPVADRTRTQPLQLVPGTTLPVSLERALKAGKTAAGTRVVTRTTQRVPINAEEYLPPGAIVAGVVVAGDSSDGAAASAGSTLTIRFTTLTDRGQTVPLSANTLAIANFTDVDDTVAPAAGGPDRGNPSPASWTTPQIGGDEVYRSGWVGPVCNDVLKTVGFADFHGVYSNPGAVAGSPDFPLAVGVFSTAAHGLYGFDSSITLHSANGVATVAGPPHKAVLRRGDNLLLQVVAP